MYNELIVDNDPKSPISEVFRTLRTNIQFMNENGKLNTLLVTSTMPGEGKTWISSNLAVTFAQAGKVVVLVDSDMRKGRLHEVFGVSQSLGLSNYLSGFEEYVDTEKIPIIKRFYESNDDIEDDVAKLARYLKKTDIENLYVLPAGVVPPNPSELLGTDKMPELLERLKRFCDLVIIDGTPCKLVTDSLILTHLVDSTVVITADKKTKKDELNRVIDNIQKVGGKISGIVVNKVQTSASKYSKYGDTYYYYGEKELKKSKKGFRLFGKIKDKFSKN